MKHLGRTEIEKLAIITDVPVMELHKLLALDLINESHALDRVVRYDFRRMKGRAKYQVCQIMEAISQKYGIGVTKVRSAVYGRKKKKLLYCEKCGRQITSRMNLRGSGKCDRCVGSEIEL